LYSVVAQTFKDFETILIDDGSTDNTEEVIEPYRDRITYVQGPNKGAAAARNKGLKIASGELIAFLDADDLWLCDKLSAQVALMNSHPEIGVCYTNFQCFGASSSTTGFEERGGALLRYGREKIGEAEYVLTSTCLLTDFLSIQAFPKPSMLMVRQPCFEQVGYFDESLSICEDTQMCLRLAKYFKFGYIDCPLVQRRVRTDTLSSAANDRRYAAVHIQMFETLGHFVPLSNIEQRAVNRALAGYCLAAGYTDFSEYQLASSRKHLWKSVKARCTAKSLFYLFLTILPVDLIKALRCLKQRLRTQTSGPAFPA
jgi:glycosyltransferase involved in cell wall biosynthesis